MRARLAGAGAMGAIALGLTGATAFADEPFRLPEPVTDNAGVLTGGEPAEIEAALAELQQEDGVQLWVVYVESFDGMEPQEWSNQTYDLSGLGVDGALLSVATEDRAYTYSVGTDFPLSDSELEEIADQDIQPLLAEEDWAGAAIAAANSYREAIGGGGDGGGVPGWVWVGGAAALGGGGFWLYRRSKRPRAAAPPSEDELAGLSTEDLGKRANALLIETDDAVKTSEQEVGFAEAQFGNEPVAEFRTAVDNAKQELAAAFALQQKLDDHQPDSEQDQRAMYTEIVQRLSAANQTLDEHAEDFDRLRDLEKTIDTELPKLGEVAASIEARIPQEQARLESLRGQYAESALATVNDNIAQSQDRLEFARTELAEGNGLLAAGKKGEAVVSARAAEEALAQGATLLDAIGRLETDLGTADEKVAAVRAETEKDLAEARALAAAGGGGQSAAQLPALAQQAEAALAAAVAATSGTAPSDPLFALRQLEQAGATLDEALVAVRDEHARAVRAAQALDQAIMAARAEISAATDFISTRRGGVGGEARTRLAEAQRHLDAAMQLAQQDPATALQHAQHADGLAEQASAQAQADVGAFQSPMGGGGGGRRRDGRIRRCGARRDPRGHDERRWPRRRDGRLRRRLRWRRRSGARELWRPHDAWPSGRRWALLIVQSYDRNTTRQL